MSEATHTPGPWEYMTELHPNSRLADSGILGYRIRGSDQGLLTTIAEIFPQAYPVAVNDANARLIAAAPELLADAIESIDSIYEIIRWMEDTALPALGDDSDGGNCLLESLKLKWTDTVAAIAKARG